ncbi:conjugal transfer protein [Desulfolucanica intricata]|uniref:conjugal transfer protein n=1 Tax=Desulfolucanica intricata TaxID=1285191 RepID=UPI00082F806A|nr:conjugal transfer protein [Desulfolucanica intricata]
MDRRLLYRWLASGVLWLLLIVIVVISIRSINIVNRTGHIAANALTIENEQTITGLRDIAQSFAVEWATWNGNPESYKQRMSLFLDKVPTLVPPDAIQEVTASSVLSVDTKNNEDYRVRVLLHAHRLVPVADAGSVPTTLIPVTREDLARLQSNNSIDISQLPASSWQDFLLYVEIPVKVENDQPVIAGWPVIITPEYTKGSIKQSSDCNSLASDDFATFVNQFMSLYYGGQPLTNFVVSGVNIKPVYGWKLESVNEVRVNNDKNPTQARVQVLVSAPGVSNLTQDVYLKLKPTGNSFLIEDLGSI